MREGICVAAFPDSRDQMVNVSVTTESYADISSCFLESGNADQKYFGFKLFHDLGQGTTLMTS